jgi:hypothetical protein
MKDVTDDAGAPSSGADWLRLALPARRAAAWSHWLLVIAALGVVVPWMVAAITGNLAIPHNDSWSYSRSAEIFARSGSIHLMAWGNMTLIGQIVLVGPLGTSISTQQTVVAVLAVVVLYCVYTLVSEALDTRRAAFATALTAIWPGFGLLATSFMTDIPALAGTFGALALGRVALRCDSRRLFYFSLVVAFWATSVREQALAAPFVVVVYGLLTADRRTHLKRRELIEATVVFVVLLLPFVYWRSHLPNADNPHMVLTPARYWPLLRVLAPEIWFSLAYGLSPAVLLTVRPQRWGPGAWVMAVLIAALAVHLLSTGGGFILGNYMSPWGEYQPVIGGLREEFGGRLPEVFNCVAAVSGVLMAGTVVERWRRVDPVLGVFTLFTGVATVLVAAGGLLAFDRYLVAMIPGLLAIILAEPIRSNVLPNGIQHRVERLTRGIAVPGCVAAFGFVAVISGLMICNAFGFDIARWHAGEQIASSTGLPRDRIDAGLEWRGTYAPQTLASVLTPCAELLASSVTEPHYTFVHSFSYKTFLLSGHSELYEYNTHAAGCPKALTG